jgi:SAM-dependent methyltransferase
MNETTAQRLIALNRVFYNQFAQDFSQTRQPLNSGIQRVLQGVLADASCLLDVGCGDARVGRAWLKRFADDGQLRYVGVDSSDGLLACHPLAQAGRLVQADLTSPHWLQSLPQATFPAVVSFAVIHHIPPPYWAGFLQQISQTLAPNGQIVLSSWQFWHSPRLLKKQVAWSQVGLSPADVGEDAFLLDWHSTSGQGVRYVQKIVPATLLALVQAAGLQVQASFLSDGANNDLGFYVVAQK